jgi:hypothetical protein
MRGLGYGDCSTSRYDVVEYASVEVLWLGDDAWCGRGWRDCHARRSTIRAAQHSSRETNAAIRASLLQANIDRVVCDLPLSVGLQDFK